MSGDFTPEQKRYLEGFITGLRSRAGARGRRRTAAQREPTGPDADHLARAGPHPRRRRQARRPGEVQARAASVRRLWAAEGAGRQQRSRRSRPTISAGAITACSTCAPAQNSYMCRLRIPNGILKHWQFAGLADLAERYGGGYAHVTTRANLQIREIEPKNAVAMVEAITDLGLCSRGSGADNIRNVTGSPTAGIDPQELIDTRPYAREWHFHILNERALYGLPRKFNVAFDGGGIIPVLEDTNDIGFQAVEVKDGFGVEPGIWFRLMLGGITGHKDFARETGVVVRPADATKVADAVVRVFIDHGDRTNRNKARLKYVHRRAGHREGRRARSRRSSAASSTASPPEALAPRPAFDRAAHIGVHPQKQAGLNWIGVVLPVGKLTAEQMRGLAGIARDARRRRYPPHRLAEPADLRRADRQGQRRGAPASRRSACPSARARSAPGSSPAPAMSAAASPPPTPSATPKRSRVVRGARRARRPGQHPSHRLPPFLRAALHRRHRAASPARCRPPRTATRSRAITSSSAAASARTPGSAREIFTTSGRGCAGDRRAPAARPISRTARSPDETFLAFTRRHDVDALKAMSRGGWRHERSAAPADPAAHSGDRAVLAEQRTWLNGFFAGLLSLEGAGHAAVAGRIRGADAGARRARPPSDDDDAPWHDQTLPIAERMKLAEGRPLRRRMMAAMAQQDCGQCGYNCQDYSDALFSRKEERLNLCVPGGKETARMLKALYEELGNSSPTHDAARRPRRLPSATAAPAAARTAAPGRSRDNPVEATFLSRTRLNKPGSEKETWHIEFDLAGSGHRLHGRRRLRHVPDQRSGARRCGDRGARRAAGFSDRRAHAARRADRRRVARRRARHAVPALLLHHRRRAAAEGEGAGGRRGPRRRCRDARRARRDPEISRRAARPRGLHRGARSAAAAALFDRLVAQGRRQPHGADRRYRALRRSTAARGSASPRPSSPSASIPATSSRSMCRRRTPSACPPIRRADHHDRPGHRRRAVPRLPARAHGDQGARPQLAVLRPPAQRLRLLLRGRTHRHEGRAAC